MRKIFDFKISKFIEDIPDDQSDRDCFKIVRKNAGFMCKCGECESIIGCKSKTCGSVLNVGSVQRCEVKS
jgi:hypothetical protein